MNRIYPSRRESRGHSRAAVCLIVNTLGFVGHTVSVLAIQPCLVMQKLLQTICKPMNLAPMNWVPAMAHCPSVPSHIRYRFAYCSHLASEEMQADGVKWLAQGQPATHVSPSHEQMREPRQKVIQPPAAGASSACGMWCMGEPGEVGVDRAIGAWTGPSTPACCYRLALTFLFHPLDCPFPWFCGSCVPVSYTSSFQQSQDLPLSTFAHLICLGFT